MDIEQTQAEHIDYFVKQASNQKGSSALATVIVEATSHPSLFAFSEILSVPSVLEVCNFLHSFRYIKIYMYRYTMFSRIIRIVECYFFLV